MEPTRRDRLEEGVRRLAVALALLGSSAVAFGASSLGKDCGQASGLNDSDELSVSLVDLTDSDTAVGDRPLDEFADADESVAPHLYLTPRIASILDDVFGDDVAVEKTVDESRESTMTPVADSSDDLTPAAQPAADTDEAPVEAQPAVMRIHREMYRTDI